MARKKIKRVGMIDLTTDQTTIIRNAWEAHEEVGGCVFAQPLCLNMGTGELKFKVFGAKDAKKLYDLLLSMSASNLRPIIGRKYDKNK